VAREGPRDLPLAKKFLFAALAISLFFLLAELGLAALGVQPALYARDPYVGFESHVPLFEPQTLPDGRRVRSTAPNKQRFFNYQEIPVDKGDDAFRIFCVGGSTTYGRPYDDRTSFCGWLRELLPVADPSHSWEVINAGGISYASYRVTVVMEELARYEPDLFVVYSGHNEFLERRTYAEIIDLPPLVRRLGALVRRTRIATVLERVVEALDRPAGDPPTDSLLDTEVTTRLDDVIGPSAFTRDDPAKQLVLEHYRFNVHRMVDIARSAGADTILVTPASNLRHSTPFKSEHRSGLGASQRQQFDDLVAAAARAREEGRWADADDALGRAAAIDDRHAQLHYDRGQILDALGRHLEAKEAYERARDEDVCPLRALSPMAPIVAEIASQEGLPLVDFERLIADRAEDGVPGQDLFFDHVHPTIDANRWLALALIDAMVDRGIVNPAASWGDEAIDRVRADVERQLDPRAHGIALMNLAKVLAWAGKHDDAYRLAKQAVELAPLDPEVRYQAGLTADLVGQVEESIDQYRRAIEIEPRAAQAHGNLGVALESTGQLLEAIDHYRRALELGDSEHEGLYRQNLADSLVVLGIAAFREQRFDEAVDHWSEANELAPDDPDTLEKLGTAQLASGHTAAAIEALAAAARLQPDDPILLNRLAVALSAAGRADEAGEVFQRALAIDPELAEAPDSLVSLLRRQETVDQPP